MIGNKRHTIRLRKLDYSKANKYFVTICAHKHGCYFDKHPTLYNIVDEEILNIPYIYRNIKIISYVIMPNHIHLIIEILFQNKDVTLGKVVGALKGKIINKWLKIIYLDKISCIACVFQRNYYEHRIRNINEKYKFLNYIKSNPKNWNTDRYNPLNLKCRGFAYRNPF